jgi:hypothetical protein
MASATCTHDFYQSANLDKGVFRMTPPFQYLSLNYKEREISPIGYPFRDPTGSIIQLSNKTYRFEVTPFATRHYPILGMLHFVFSIRSETI